jgi:hypothetical protein
MLASQSKTDSMVVACQTTTVVEETKPGAAEELTICQGAEE